MKIITRLLAATAVAATGAALALPTAAQAISGSAARVSTPGIPGVMYIDPGNGQYCPVVGGRRAGITGDSLGYDFDANGTIRIPGGSATTTLTCVGAPPYFEVEVYPVIYGTERCGWDPFTSPAGGARFRLPPGGNVGTINLPTASNGGIKVSGRVYRATGTTPNCSIAVDLFEDKGFQIGKQGAFGSYYANKGNELNTGYIFPGRYSLFITDEATNTQIRAETTFDANSTFDVDLDASCFGFDWCTYIKGGPPANGGGFHPLPPARILDTRSGIGITNGRIRPGDGSLRSEPNPDMRADEANNHQTKVTGVGGVPEHGVSAVLLNVTEDQPDGDGWLAVTPKLPRTDIFHDQSWFRTGPGTSNLNFRKGQTVPNLVLARVGAGGRIMIETQGGALNGIADVVGWFDTGSGGDGFTGVTPDRILDTRQPGGGGAFGPRETRRLQVTGRANVPAGATAVVLNVTQIGATAFGYVTVWPAGIPQPGTSNLNGAPGRTRPNLVVTKVGTGGQIDMFNYDGQSDIAVDVVGYFSPTGAKVYPVTPTRIMDSRSGYRTPASPFGPSEVRNVAVVGIAGVPADATGIVANITGLDSSIGSFLTVYPTGTALPPTSTVNLDPVDASPNLVIMKVGAGGQISISNDRGTANVIVDVMGYTR